MSDKRDIAKELIQGLEEIKRGMSDTPRTDAAQFFQMEPPGEPICRAEFARQLERELNDAKAAIARAVALYQDMGRILLKERGERG